MAIERLTVSLPDELVRGIDRQEKNRSKFVAEAVRRELERRTLEQLRESTENPHPETLEMAELGFGEWAKGLPSEDAEGLVDPQAGVAIRWIPGEGWVEGGA